MAARLATQNEAIRAKCATPGFGWVVLMLRASGLGSTSYHRDTYAEVKAIADKEVLNKDYVRGALIIQKTYNHEKMLGGRNGAGSAPSRRDFERAADVDDDLG